MLKKIRIGFRIHAGPVLERRLPAFRLAGCWRQSPCLYPDVVECRIVLNLRRIVRSAIGLPETQYGVERKNEGYEGDTAA